MKNKEEKNICKVCIYYRSLISTDIIFTEIVEVCSKLKTDWPYEKDCKYFKSIK